MVRDQNRQIGMDGTGQYASSQASSLAMHRAFPELRLHMQNNWDSNGMQQVAAVTS
jgi:hypothetical protein